MKGVVTDSAVDRICVQLQTVMRMVRERRGQLDNDEIGLMRVVLCDMVRKMNRETAGDYAAVVDVMESGLDDRRALCRALEMLGPRMM